MPKTEEIIQFSEAIENRVREKNLTYMEAICSYCEETNFEVEQAASLLTYTIKEKIQREAEGLHYLPKPKTTKLPFYDDED